MLNRVYLDNSATTKPRAEVVSLTAAVMEDEYANPSSLHDAGLAAEKIVEAARARLSAAIAADFGVGAGKGLIVFTSGGTESDNMALLCGARSGRRRGRRIITTRIEHPAVLESCAALAEEGFETVYADVDSDGVAIPESVEAAMGPEAVMISCMSVNNETGAVQPLERIAALKDAFERREGRRLLLHTDAVQSFCKLAGLSRADGAAVSEGPAGADMISLSAHKLHGPKGAGALYLRKGLAVGPFVRGGGQEGGLRSGTENVPCIAGFGLAAKLAADGRREAAERAGRLRSMLLDGIMAEVRDVRLNSSAPLTSPFILNLSFLGAKGEVLLHDLERMGVLVSTGAACSSKKRGRSHVLAAMGLTEAEAEGAIRFSLGAFSTEAEIERAVAAVKEAVARFRRVGRFR
ncbi:MAG: cysteine desulfurase [Clostridiales Family XIII bacterium]|jgi:cysteine desulfurase|nr:cysteine desulfurase [Clostridiales Family XIII bacterium]